MMNCPDSFTLIHLDETDSTNNYLDRLDGNNTPAEFTVVSTDFQTAGKGQRGNSWEAEKGKNLLFSFVLYPLFLEAHRQFLLSQLISLSIKEELDEYAKGFSIKWPNDIYWNDKKICGILIENDWEGNSISRCITGVGLNVNQARFTSNAPNPVSLKQITGQEHDRRTLLNGIMHRAGQYYQQLRKGNMDHLSLRYSEALFRKEGMYPYTDEKGKFLARIANVEADGHLVLQDERGSLRRYLFKEVEFVL